MPYDKDGKYYRKPVFNENFKGLKKKPLKKEYKQNKIILKLVFSCLRFLVYIGTMVGILYGVQIFLPLFDAELSSKYKKQFPTLLKDLQGNECNKSKASFKSEPLVFEPLQPIKEGDSVYETYYCIGNRDIFLRKPIYYYSESRNDLYVESGVVGFSGYLGRERVGDKAGEGDKVLFKIENNNLVRYSKSYGKLIKRDINKGYGCKTNKGCK